MGIPLSRSPMEIKILTQNIKLSETQEAHIQGKFEKLGQFAQRISDESSEVRVELSREASRSADDAFVCKLTLFVPQDTLRVEARNSTLENAIDEVLEKIKGPIERYKDKTQHISEKK